MRARLTRDAPFDYTGVIRNNDSWPDHRARAMVTGALLAWMSPQSVLDPACGDGSIVLWANDLMRLRDVALADLSDANMDTVEAMCENMGWGIFRGDVGEVIEMLGSVDVIVLTEILEHLPDPDTVLRLAATKAKRLLVSSPEMRPGQVDNNPEHLWMFDGAGYEKMLNEAGWNGVHKTHLTFRSEYDFQIWVCER